MNIKNEIIRAALIGTQRSKLSKEHKAFLAELGVPTQQEEERIILAAMAVLSKAERASFQATEIPLDNLSKVKLGEENICSAKSIHHLSLIIEGSYQEALPEFLAELARNKKNLPPDALPGLLYHSVSSKELWKQLQPSIGKRGEWLIEQNPDWSVLMVQKQDVSWEDASNEERVALLQKEKETNPQQAMQWLKETWETEGAKQRLALLEAMKGVDTPEWETFLESTLDGRHKGIRKAAIHVLAQMPHSQLSQRMQERAKPLLKVHKKLLQKVQLTIQLPEEIGEDWIRDGIDPSVQWFKGGLKASRLGQVVALVSPKFWMTYYKKEAQEVLSLFTRSEYGVLLYQALVEATALHQNEEWAEVLLTYRLEQQGSKKWDEVKIKPLLGWMPDAVFNTVVQQALSRNTQILEDSPITMILKTSHAQWTNEVSFQVIQALKKGMEREKSKWNAWHYKNILKKAAYQCSPDSYSKLNSYWMHALPKVDDWQKEIEEFLAVLYFRMKMIQELKS